MELVTRGGPPLIGYSELGTNLPPAAGTRTAAPCGWQSPENARWEKERKQFRMEAGKWRLDAVLFDLAADRATNGPAGRREVTAAGPRT